MAAGQSLAVIVVGADRLDSQHIRHLHRHLPPLWVHLSIAAAPLVGVVAGAIDAVHIMAGMVSALIGAALVAQQPVNLTLQDGAFLLKDGENEQRVDILSHASGPLYPADRLALAFSGKEIVLQAGSIGLKENGRMMGTSSLPVLATSPAIYSEAERTAIKQKIEAGTRKAGFSSVAGYEYLGSTLYLLLRWEEASGAPWMEALVGIDLDKEGFTANYVGSFRGYSFARGAVHDRLHSDAGDLVALTQTGDSYGLSRWDAIDKEVSFRPFGPPVNVAVLMEEGRSAVALRLTDYKTTLATVAPVSGGPARPAAEVRGAIKGLVEPHFLRYIREDGQPVLLNLKSGAELEIARGLAVAGVRGGYALAWSPAKDPVYAIAYEAETWRPLAEWSPGR